MSEKQQQQIDEEIDAELEAESEVDTEGDTLLADEPLDDESDVDGSLLNLADLAPPRQLVLVPSGSVTVALKSPKEFGSRDQARLQQYQRQIRKLTSKKQMSQQEAAKLDAYYSRVTRMILDENVDDEDFAKLTDTDMAALAMVFTIRSRDFMRKLVEEAGDEKTAMEILDEVSGLT